MKKRFLPLMLSILAVSLLGCGSEKKPDNAALYDELLNKFISGEEMFSDEGEGYDYSEAKAPGYAMYDIDKDGTDELFITPRKDDEWHTYSVYYIKNDKVTRGRALNGYLPDEDYWTYSFDYFVEAYKFDQNDGFTSQWELDYPWVDGIDENTLITQGQEPKELTDDEVNTLLAGHITEPEDIRWLPLGNKASAKENAGDSTNVSADEGTDESVNESANDDNSDDGGKKMGEAAKLLYQGHASVRITTPEGKTIYVDPYAGEGYDVPADLILETHGHFDHTQTKEISTKNDGCRTITWKDAISNGKHQSFHLGYVNVEAVEAGYNKNHNVKDCVGFILTFSNGVTLYLSGDTSTTPQMAELADRNLDYAFICCDGVYNMDVKEAMECAKTIGAKHTVPYHMIPADKTHCFDQSVAESFDVPGRIIVKPGEELVLE